MIPLQDVIDAARKTLVGKRGTVEAQEFEYAFYRNCKTLWREVNEGRYKPSRYIAFISKRPVVREIFGSHIRDRVVDTLIVMRILPYVERQLVDDNYSTREGKGTLYGVRRVEEMIRRVSENYTRDCYILKEDIWSFFMSIPKDRACQLWEDFLHANYHEPDCELIISLLKVIICDRPEQHCVRKGYRSDWDLLPPHKSMFNADGTKGLPIGKVIIQVTALLYLDALDHKMATEWGVPENGHYMDDRVMVHTSREHLQQVRQLLAEGHREIGLKTHPKKTYLQHYSKGVLFAGAMILPGRTYVSNRTLSNCFDRLEDFNREAAKSPRYCEHHAHEFAEVMNSYFGTLSHFTEWNTIHRLISAIDANWYQVMEVVGRKGHYHICLHPRYSEKREAKQVLDNNCWRLDTELPMAA